MKNQLYLTTDEKLIIVDSSSGFLELVGKTRSSVIGKPLDEWVGKDCLRALLKDILRAYRGDEIKNHLATFMIGNHPFHFSIDIKPGKIDPKGYATKLTLTFTDRRKAVNCQPLEHLL